MGSLLDFPAETQSHTESTLSRQSQAYRNMENDSEMSESCSSEAFDYSEEESETTTTEIGEIARVDELNLKDPLICFKPCEDSPTPQIWDCVSRSVFTNLLYHEKTRNLCLRVIHSIILHRPQEEGKSIQVIISNLAKWSISCGVKLPALETILELILGKRKDGYCLRGINQPLLSNMRTTTLPGSMRKLSIVGGGSITVPKSSIQTCCIDDLNLRSVLDPSLTVPNGFRIVDSLPIVTSPTRSILEPKKTDMLRDICGPEANRSEESLFKVSDWQLLDTKKNYITLTFRNLGSKYIGSCQIKMITKPVPEPQNEIRTVIVIETKTTFTKSLQSALNILFCSPFNSEEILRPSVEFKPGGKIVINTDLLELGSCYIFKLISGLPLSEHIDKGYFTAEQKQDKSQFQLIIERVKQKVYTRGEQLDFIKLQHLESLNDVDEDGDRDLQVDTINVSLICPLSMDRIEIPVKGKDCAHIRCFDLASYVSFNLKPPYNEKSKTYKCLLYCPECNKSTPMEDLVFSEYMNDILTSMPDVDSVDVICESGDIKLNMESPFPNRSKHSFSGRKRRKLNQRSSSVDESVIDLDD